MQLQRTKFFLGISMHLFQVKTDLNALRGLNKYINTNSSFWMNGGGGAGLQTQELSDWTLAALKEVQSADPLHISDA